MTGDGRRKIRRALISVYDKTGLAELARGLHDAGVDIVSTGSTAKTIAGAGVPVTPVEKVTGFPEVLDGRVKTLHPHVHAGLLADQRKPEHVAALADLDIAPFELVVVNLYPFTETVDSGASVDECVEQIDIGGPSMVRAAAKNHPSVAVVVDPLGYDGVLAAVRAGGFTLDERKKLASLAFRHTAEYDVAVASWMGSVLAPEQPAAPLPAWLGATWKRSAVLRYGENPHQQAALYRNDAVWPGLAQAEQLHGKEMSYNNYTDADAAWRAAFDHEDICVAIIKHANPCGIAISSVSVADAHRKAHECDPLSAFGGVIAANTAVSVEMAETVADIFTEVIIAPAYEPGAVEVLARKKNIRVLVASEPQQAGTEFRQISGGLLLQQRDAIDAQGDDPVNWTLATGEPADPETLADLTFAWRTCRAVKSNAIVVAKGGATVGVGMGQVNRVDAARLAVERGGDRVADAIAVAKGGTTVGVGMGQVNSNDAARLAVERGGDRVAGAVAASDAFFPFPDGLETLTAAGVKAIVHPGGSMRDDVVTEAAAKAGITLYLTGARHFAH
ncbi:bifunctional phosphoribosylaminoimidazolecarboxamide formyltransferase/IMP cyclohydrolase [Mycobacterium sp. 3519A]|uniref:bifunctional phosphoribosylaminoimidazolecarboxamide formyltransferase/IMP cyclohydrolase n=1 Tax=Mycobacterium sp. 3519A TaxID=2057184 RepID=UPI001F46AC18|nr:bifunctional phosphoribosylaminoimidazolecarboxamide formyltransferase/IMP cyclohydrolase [Mycobacterium sp. 3519A]